MLTVFVKYNNIDNILLNIIYILFYLTQHNIIHKIYK